MLQYSHTAHQRIPASKQTQPVQMLSQFTDFQGSLELTTELPYLLEERTRNWLVSHVRIEQLRDVKGSKKMVRLKGK